MDDHTILAIVALLVLCVVEVTALCLGINGAYLATVLAILGACVAGPAGYRLKAIRG